MDKSNRDLTGQRFGRWTVLGPCEINEKGERKWLCRCDCGTERYVLERSLLYGFQSCGGQRKRLDGLIDRKWRKQGPMM